jgi:hydrogenase nickel incorporation protein HypA/HybF
MHEHHAVQNLVNQAVEKAGTKKVIKVCFGLGELVGFDDESIGLYFDQMKSGTLLEGATLEIKHYLPKLKCKDCSLVFEDSERKFICPSCSSTSLSLQSGKEFFLESIETE